MILCAAYVGPFAAYENAAYALVVSAHPDKLAMPRWSNTKTPSLHIDQPPTDETLLAAIEAASEGCVVLLFDDWTFKTWQIALLEVIAT